MKITFGKGILCCGCKRRFGNRDIAYQYKETCLCNNCHSKFMRYSDEAYFEVSDNVEFLVPAFHYKRLYRKIFLDFKFNSCEAYGHILGMAMADVLKNRDDFSEYSYIVPVPVSKERFMERGYNQSEILAEYISGVFNIPIYNALRRKRHSAPQSTVKNSRRAENVKDAYETIADVTGKNVVLIDDICTTGSTVSECAKTLQKSGAGKVCVISGAYNVRMWIDRTIHRFI